MYGCANFTYYFCAITTNITFKQLDCHLKFIEIIEWIVDGFIILLLLFPEQSFTFFISKAFIMLVKHASHLQYVHI